MTQDYKEILERITARTIASDVLANIPTIGFWVKDMDYRFLEISETASQILYWLWSDQCIWKTDLEIAKTLWLEMSEKQFSEICRGSDLYILENPKQNKYHNYFFYEFLKDTKWNPHIWKTLKWVYPEIVDKWSFIYWQALFIDVLYWTYEKALERFEVEKILYNKINNNLYVNK